MNKRSQIFLFDLIFAFVILTVTLALFYAYYLDVDENTNIYDLNMNILNGFTNTKINSLNDVEIRDFFIQYKITNIDNSVAEQVVEFHHNGQSEDASKLTRIFVQDYVDKQMNFVLSLENETGGNYTVLYEYPTVHRISFENSTIATSSERLIFSFQNQSEFYGPYVFKVRIWK